MFYRQVYADWWYTWCLTYFIGSKGVHRYIYITLKKSLQYLPIVGWVCSLNTFRAMLTNHRPRECNCSILSSFLALGLPTERA